MPSHEPFDLADTPLEPGTLLLEASAGSGKTFTIEGLFIRLLLEQDLDVAEILVCTYTKAATAELQDRVRQRIVKTVRELAAGNSDYAAIRNAVAAQGNEAVAARLRTALERYDETQVFTIHSFCSRILAEHAFESGSTFNTAFVADSAPVDEQIVRDFARRMLEDQPTLAACIASENSLLDRLRALLRKQGPHRDMELLPLARNEPPLGHLEAGLNAVFLNLLDIWEADADVITDQITDDKSVNVGLYRDALVHADCLTDACTARLPHAGVLRAIRTLRQSHVESQIKKKKPRQQIGHRFFEACEAFCEVLDQANGVLARAFLRTAADSVEAARTELNVMTFDDLLQMAARAVDNGGSVFARAVSGRYKAALIDEFQDTDPLQWQIFRSLFGAGEHHFYIIGDPKQAIYRFRGADVHSYLEAATRATRVLTLDTNWRSDALLVNGVNAVFSAVPGVFRTPGIGFTPARTRATPEPDRLFACEDGCAVPLRWVIHDGSLPTGNAPQRNEWTFGHLIGDIARLLDSGSRIGPRPVRPHDIAVLTRGHREGRALRDALRQKGIPAVLGSDASVFDSAEAGALALVLQAVCEPGNAGLVRAALLGPLFSLSSARIAGLRDDDNGWQDLVDRFARYNALWHREGIIVALNRLAGDCALRERLLAGPDGERVLTNVLHLMELLHTASVQERLSAPALVQWLLDRIANPDTRPQDGHELRLETDSEAVQILTIHKSKGLEFPFVYCPGLLQDSTPRTNEYIVQREADGRKGLWLRPYPELDPDVQAAALEEELAGNLRLLYVALTRARNRCTVYVIPSDVKDAASVALCQCLGAPDGDALAAALGDLAAAHPQCLHVDQRGEPPPVPTVRQAADNAAALVCRTLQVTPDTRGLLCSFSSLHGDIEAVELPDREDAPLAATPAPLAGIAAFPRGTAAGNCFHACFEHLDYAAPDTWEAGVREQLLVHGIDAATHCEAALATVRNALESPLWPDGPRLCSLPPRTTLREVEFYFPVRKLDVRDIAAAFEQAGGSWAAYAPAVRQLDARDVDGYMKGYIDLVFRHDGRYHILDWKSNWLGADPAAYTPATVANAMLRQRYFLQYTFYTLALHRHLRARLPGYSYAQHIGGACYVFLRGLDSARPGWSTHRALPPLELIEALDAALCAGEVPS